VYGPEADRETDMPARPLRELFPDLGRRTLIMGILNVTPDSFSDGGMHIDPEAAIDHAFRMMDEGADLIDIGGESTRPDAERVSVESECARVLPVIGELRKRGVGPLSIDTTKAIVAERAIDAGADLVNDVSAFAFDPDMAATVAKHHVPVVLMHTRGRPDVMQKGPLEYEGGVVRAVVDALERAIAAAVSAGIARDDIVVDPGIGFGKTVEQNTELILRLSALKSLGRPILIGPSRKSFLGRLTGKDVDQRVFATAATVALAIAGGADLVRVHDVGAMHDVVKVSDAIVRRSVGG
jgi:dihydropteroate synthase